MENYPEALTALIDGLKQLPGVGRRSAERMAMAMLKWPEENLREFGKVVAALPDKISRCPVCGNLAEPQQLCSVCSASNRMRNQICVVEDVSQLLIIEKSGAYRGLYHVLGGKLSPLNNLGEEDLNIASLSDRIEAGGVDELIIALGGDVEARATGFMLADKYSGRSIKITVLAQGLPAGANLTYADSATINAALSHRRNIGE